MKPTMVHRQPIARGIRVGIRQLIWALSGLDIKQEKAVESRDKLSEFFKTETIGTWQPPVKL